MTKETRSLEDADSYRPIRKSAWECDPDRLLVGMSAAELVMGDEIGSPALVSVECIALQLSPDEQAGYADYLESGAAFGQAA